MNGYRIYTIGEDGHFIGRTEFYCPDDETALKCAKQLVDGRAIELWESDRLIARIEGSDSPAAGT